MSIPLVDLRAQYASLKNDLDAAILRIMSNASFVLGPEVEAFESAFAAYCGTEHAIGVSSGTGALQMALMAYGVGPGDEVITTPFTFIATAAAISHVGAMPVFCDIDLDTYNIDPSRIEAAITPRTRAIIPVHLYGQPADMDPINEIARRHGLKVIEDACQAVGATYRGAKAGNLADVGCFSFYPSKNLGAAGDGGMLVTNDSDLANRVRLYRDHGRTDHYGHGCIGFTHRLDALQAAILGVKLQHLDAWNAARRALAGRYTDALSGTPAVTPQELPACQSVYHCYVVRVPDRERVLGGLRQGGIGASVHYPRAVHQQPAYAHLALPDGAFPVAETAARQVLSLPIYPEMTETQVGMVSEALAELLAS